MRFQRIEDSPLCAKTISAASSEASVVFLSRGNSTSTSTIRPIAPRPLTENPEVFNRLQRKMNRI